MQDIIEMGVWAIIGANEMKIVDNSLQDNPPVSSATTVTTTKT